MPIFDEELIYKDGKRPEDTTPSYSLGSPMVSPMPSLPSLETASPNLSREGLSIADLSNIAKLPGQYGGPNLIPKSELIANKRYNTYVRGMDLEDIYGRQQSWLDQLANGAIKMAGTAVGTFAQSFATIPNTINAARHTNIAELSGDPDGYEGSIDRWVRNLEDDFPNYMTKYERDHPYLRMVPFMPGSANFWGNDILKNTGFMVGAIGGAIAQDVIIGGITGGIGELPVIGSQLGKAALWLNKIFAGADKASDVLTVAKQAGVAKDVLLDIKKLQEAASLVKLNNGFRYGMSIYGSARTEAAIEARDAFRMVKEELVSRYKIENGGKEPVEADLNKINEYATDAMNSRFGINMALLTLSNTIQFGNLFKSFTTASTKGVSGALTRELEDVGKIGLKQGSLDVFEAKAPTTIGAKVWNAVRPSIPNVLSEGVYEEGGQYAAERGVFDYYTRKYKNLNNPENRDNWNTTREVIDSTTKGLSDQFGTTEGVTNMVIGAISAMISGAAMNRIDAAKGRGKDARQQAAINVINQYGMTGVLGEKFSSVVNSAGIAKEMEAAVAAKDVFRYKNLQGDLFFEYVKSRLPIGMHDVTVEQLNLLKDLDKEQFEKHFGMDFNASNKATVNAYVDSLVNEANSIKKTYDSISSTFKNPFQNFLSSEDPAEAQETEKHNLFNEWKENLVYYAHKVPQLNNRLGSIQQSLYNINPQLTNELISQLTNKEMLKELGSTYEQKAAQLGKTITELTTPKDTKVIRDQIKALRTASERINLAINDNNLDEKTFDYLLNFELNNQDPTKEKVIGSEWAPDLIGYGHDINRIDFLKKRARDIFEDLSSEKGFNKFFDEVNKMREEQTQPEAPTPETPAPDAPKFTNKNGERESLILNREYIIPELKRAKIDKIADDRWQLTLPNGDVTFHSSEEKAKEALQETEGQLANLSKVKVLAFNPDGTIKIEDVNGDIYNIDLEQLSGYERIMTEQEKLTRVKDDVEKEQDDVEKDSGNAATGDVDVTSEEFDNEGSARKHWWNLFLATTSASEDRSKDVQKPHIQRAIKFLNNAKLFPNRKKLRAIFVTKNQQDSLGLENLVELSMEGTGVSASEYTNLDSGVVMVVYVEQDGENVYFVDSEGNRLNRVGEKADLSKIVFATMPTTSLTWRDSTAIRYIQKEEEEVKEQQAKWRAKRDELFNNPPGKYEIYSFRISRGIPNIGEVGDKIGVGKELIPEDIISKHQGLVAISTTGFISHQGESIKVPTGRAMFQFEDTLTWLNGKKFDKKSAQAVFQVMKLMADDIKRQADAGKKVKINRNYATFLQNVLYWRKGPATSKNQIHIDVSTMDFYFGGDKYDITNLQASENDIVAKLQEVYQNINDVSLTKNFNEPFREYYIEDDKLTSRQWKNYQTYLLASSYPDGKSRSGNSIPLTTNIIANPEGIAFSQKYAVLQGVEFPPISVKPTVKEPAPPPPVAPPTIGTYKLDGSKNTYQFKSGPVNFTGTLTPEGEVKITIDPDKQDADTIKKVAKDEAVQGVIINSLKEAGLSAPEDASKRTVMFMTNAIAADLTKQMKQPSTSPDVVPTAPTAPVSDIEAEKRRIREDKLAEIEARVDPLGDEYARTKRRLQNEDDPEEQLSLRRYLNELDIERKRIEKEIDDKYDAELAALEGAKPKKEKKPPPNTKYRAVREDGKSSRLTLGELQLFKEWAARAVPTIPYEILENIITVNDTLKAWGKFENGVASVYKGALRGTEYHEMFHPIYTYFIPEVDKMGIEAEFRARRGTFKDRITGKTIAYSEATADQIEDRLADEFTEFRLGKLPARTLGEKILRFFRTIIEFFKSFVQKPSLKQQMFDAIDAGKFKEMKLPESAFSAMAKYRAVDGLTEEKTNEYVQDMTARIFQDIFGKNSSLYNIENITAPEIFNKIRAAYDDEGKMDEITETAWWQLVTKTKEFLRTFRIEFDDEQRININDENYDNRGYAPEPFVTDWKKTSSFPIKLLMGTLTETNPMDQRNASKLEYPSQKTSSVLGYKLLNFSRAFATGVEKFSNTTAVGKLVNKLVDLARGDSNYVRLYTRLGGKMGDLEGETVTIDFSKFQPHDWRLFINFYQTFTRQKPNALVQYVQNGNVYTGSASAFTAVNNTKDQWIQNLRTIARDKDSIVSYNLDDKTYRIKNVSDVPINTPEQKIAFLAEMGVVFPMETFLRLSTERKNNEVEAFNKAVQAIHTYINTKEDVMTFTGDTIGIGGQLNKLAELYVRVTNPNYDPTHFNVEGERTQSVTDNNAASVFENEFNESDTLDELFTKRPELQDVFSANSLILKKGGLYFDEEGKRVSEMKVAYIQGTKSIDANKGTSTKRLVLGDRVSLEINQNLNGYYYILVPADSSTEWMMEMGNYIKYGDVETGDAWKDVYNIFRNYLKDEFALALSDRSYIKNTSPRAKELRFFKDILPAKLLDKANNLIVTRATTDEINEFISTNLDEIDAAVKSFIDLTVADTKTLLKDSGQLYTMSMEEGQEPSYSWSSLDDNFAKNEKLDKENLTDEEVNTVLTFANINYVINNIEFHKILFGDPYQFKIEGGQLDEVKRIKSFLSPRRTTFDTPEINNALNNEWNRAGDIPLGENDPGFHEFKPYTNTVTLADVNVVGSIAQLKGVPEDIKKAYTKTKETDGASWIMDNTYREVKLKNGQWTDEAEAWHQWQMAYTRQRMPGYKYTNNALERHDIELVSSGMPKYIIDVMKPIVSGNKYGKNQFDVVLDKFSQMPIYYSMVEGTNLEKMYIKMLKENIGYAVFESGRKVGTETTFNMYDKDDNINEAPFTNIVKVAWKSYGIQVETSFDSFKEVTRGSQITKLSSLDLFNNGVPISEEARKEYERNKQLLNDMHINAYRELLNRLGIQDLGDGFKIVNYKAIAESLEYELFRRELSDNAKDTVKLNDEGTFRIPFEASTNYIQIRDILYSMIDKAIVSPKVNGGAYVQVPVTGFEKGKRIAVQSSPTLKFYTKDAPYCEIMLPHFFKDKLNRRKFKTDEQLLNHLNKTEEGKKILTGVGFRIPTQSVSSAEVFKIKGFLPESMGYTVVVPSEITTKAGSDFDIDKLNLYLKSTYIDNSGNPRLVKYLGSESSTKDFYSNIFDEALKQKKIKKDELFKALSIRTYDLEDKEGLLDRYNNLLDALLSQYDDETDLADKLMKDLEMMGDEKLQSSLKDKFVREMYKRSLENEYYDSLEKLLQMNFDRLISPVTDGGLKATSQTLDLLRREDEANIKNKMLNRSYLSSLRNAFVTAKRWVGIAAVNITGHSLAQKTQLYLDPVQFNKLTDYDRKILGDGNIVLPHNTTTVDGKNRISLSGQKTVDGKNTYISDRLSGYATAFVDVAKDPYIMKIIQSDMVVGTFMFLERIGAGETVPLFMNQPIITEYLKYLDSIGSRSLYSKENLEYIKDRFPSTQKEFEDAQIDVNMLAGNIETYYEKKKFGSTADNAVQLKILNEFLKYTKMAQFNFKLTQASNYDTTKFRSADAIRRKIIRTVRARELNIFSSVDKLLDNSFIGEQANLLYKLTDAMGEALKLDKYEFKAITNRILDSYAMDDYLSDDDFSNIGLRITTSFLDYIIQTKTGLNKELKPLLVDASTSVATSLVNLRKQFPEMRLLQDLQVKQTDRPDGTKTVSLNVNLKDAYDENLYTGMMRELRDNPATRDFYYDLVILSILQGTYRTAFSIKNIVPIEDYSDIVADTIRTLVADGDLDYYTKGPFQRNNWKNPNVFTRFSPKFFLKYQEPVSADVDDFGNITDDIYQYFSFSFPNIKPLGIEAPERKLMLVSEKYNRASLESDYLLVNRITTDPRTGEKVDMRTGQTATDRQLSRARKSGDTSINEVYGYQKVKNIDGSPLIIYDDKGEGSHVYKLINLWGDGDMAGEYYMDDRESALSNGTVKVRNEMPDSDIINYYSGNLESPAETPAPAAPITFEQAFDAERQQSILANFAKKHNMSSQEALEYIRNGIASRGQGAINKLDECY